MSALLSRIAALLVSLAIGSSAAESVPVAQVRGKDDGGVQQWTNREGKVIDAHFVNFDGHKVDVLSKMGRHSISIDKLSPESLIQAKRMSGIIGVFKPVRKGRFMMGSPLGEPGREDHETHHEVVTSGFSLKATEVTWTEWNAVLNFAENYGYIDISKGSNGSRGFDADLNPVVGITWWDAVKWCNLKSQLDQKTPVYYTDKSFNPKFLFKTETAGIHAKWDANGYRLPTEAEWEFACRTRDSKWAFHTGSIEETGTGKDSNLAQAGWYAFNSNDEPQPVAEKTANQFGLYDMHGNAAEWCWDFYSIPGAAEIQSPRGPLRGDRRVIRGGAWNSPASACRSAARSSLTPGATPDRLVGFRPVLPWVRR